MTKYQRLYLTKCLKYLQMIISNPEVVKYAIALYAGKDKADIRYHLRTNISELCMWDSEQILNFKAALFEAEARASIDVCPEPDKVSAEYLKELQEARVMLLEVYQPMLTNTIQHNQPLTAIQNNIHQVQAQIKHDLDGINHPPFRFFAIGALAIAATVAAAAVWANKN